MAPGDAGQRLADMDIREVIIFCADGDTGVRLAQLLQWSGRRTIGVIREWSSPEPLERYDANVVIAEPTDREEVAKVFEGRSPEGLAVVCMLGGTPGLNSQGNINVIDAAAKAGVKRFFMLTSVGCGDSRNAVDPQVRRFIGKALRAKDWAETHLRNTDMDWTIIRPGGMLRRKRGSGAMLVDSPTVTGYINMTDLGELIFYALESAKTVGRVMTAVDRGRAFDISGNRLIPAEL